MRETSGSAQRFRRGIAASWAALVALVPACGGGGDSGVPDSIGGVWAGTWSGSTAVAGPVAGTWQVELQHEAPRVRGPVTLFGDTACVDARLTGKFLFGDGWTGQIDPSDCAAGEWRLGSHDSAGDATGTWTHASGEAAGIFVGRKIAEPGGPWVRSVHPPAASPGGFVTIVGQRLGEPLQPAPMRFGTTPQTRIDVHSDEHWVFRVPDGAASGLLVLQSSSGHAMAPFPFLVGPASPAPTVAWEIATAARPQAATVSPDGTKLYVLCTGGIVQVVDTARRQVLATAALGGPLHSVAASPDGRAVFSAQTGRVARLDPMRLRQLGTITVGTGEARAYLAVSPDNGAMLISGPPAPSPIDRFSRVTLVRLLDGEPRWQLSYRDNPVFGGVAFSPDGTRAYLVADMGAKGVLWQFDVETGPTAADLDAPIDLPRRPTHLAVSPDGTTAFVVHSGSQSVSRVDLTAREVTAAGLAAPAVGLAYAPNGETVFVATVSGVVVLRSDSGTIAAGPILVAGAPSAIAMDPRGQRAYVLHAEPNGIAAIGATASRIDDPPVAAAAAR